MLRMHPPTTHSPPAIKPLRTALNYRMHPLVALLGSRRALQNKSPPKLREDILFISRKSDFDIGHTQPPPGANAMVNS